MELVGGPQGARLRLPDRRAGRRRTLLVLRGRLRRARAGAAERGAGRTDPDPRRGRPRAGAPGGALARRGHRALPGRLLPDAAAARSRHAGRPGRRGGPGGGRGAAAGAGRGLGPAGLPAPRRPPPAPRRRPDGPEPLRPRGVGARPHRGALRLPLPHRDLRARRTSACTATTCCRSCSGTGSSRGSTSRRTGRGAPCWSRRRTPSRARPAETAEELLAALHRAGRLAGARRGRSSVRRGDLGVVLASLAPDAAVDRRSVQGAAGAVDLGRRVGRGAVVAERLEHQLVDDRVVGRLVVLDRCRRGRRPG